MSAGWGKRSYAAITGSIISDLFICIFGYAVTTWFHLDGAVLPMSESLLYAGFPSLNLTGLFIGVMTLSSGGAVMDLSIDVAAAMKKVQDPSAPALSLFRSGMAVGRAGVGTQATTLLLAYMGNYMSVMMVYMYIEYPDLEGDSGGADADRNRVHGSHPRAPVTAVVASFFLKGNEKKLDRSPKPCEK